MLVLAALIVFGGVTGALHSVDKMLQSWRFEASSRPATGNVVVASIDPASLKMVGVWPWPRHVYGEVIDKLLDAGADDIYFDVDFSAASTPAEDDAFAKSLANAGGYVALAVFRQSGVENGPASVNIPIAKFRDQAELVAVNVPVDHDGLVRNYSTGLKEEGDVIPSLAEALVSGVVPKQAQFGIDYSIDASTIPRVSIADILSGTFDPARVAGKHIIIGATALELRDTLAVPRFGTLPGVLVHAMAAETLLQNRALTHAPLAVSLLVALVAGALVAFVLHRISVISGFALALTISAGVEILALELEPRAGIEMDTVIIHVALLAVGLVVLAQELIQKGFVLDRTARAHQATRNVLDRVMTDNFDGVLVIDRLGEVVLASKLAKSVLSNEENETLVGQQAGDVLPGELSAHIEAALSSGRRGSWGQAKPREVTYSRDGAEDRILEYVITVSEPEPEAGKVDKDDPTSRVACLTFRDVTDRHKAEQRLTYLATHDPLTGALSRTRLADLMNTLMGDEARRANGVTVFLLDLSRFKEVNDTLGHSYGDALLKEVVARLTSAEVSGVARLGGDNFALVRTGTFSSTGVGLFCESILDSISEPYQLDIHRAIVGARLGVTDSRTSGYDPDVLLSHAGMALSTAKSQPGNSYAFYTPELDDRLREYQSMEVALRQAIAKNQLHLVYQPQVSLADDSLIGVEALVRWQHPELGAVSPGRFIPVAEETGLILELGDWILNAACKEAVTWPVPIKLAVNVSPLQFEFTDVVKGVREALNASGLPPARLDVEITEGMLVSKSAPIIEKLEALREMGVGIALDDFGTGYSSLSYLGRLPVDKIKIDQSFVRALPNSEESGAIIRAIMTLSESLGKTVVAEGIENADQAWMLRLAGAHIGQGYLYGRPLSAETLVGRMAELGAEAEPQRKVAG